MLAADVIRIVERFGIGVHQCADDTDIYSSSVARTVRHYFATISIACVRYDTTRYDSRV